VELSFGGLRLPTIIFTLNNGKPASFPDFIVIKPHGAWGTLSMACRVTNNVFKSLEGRLGPGGKKVGRFHCGRWHKAVGMADVTSMQTFSTSRLRFSIQSG